jgi:hypothetical protein
MNGGVYVADYDIQEAFGDFFRARRVAGGIEYALRQCVEFLLYDVAVEAGRLRTRHTRKMIRLDFAQRYGTVDQRPAAPITSRQLASAGAVEPTRNRVPKVKCSTDPPPAATVWMLISRIRTPATCDVELSRTFAGMNYDAHLSKCRPCRSR